MDLASNEAFGAFIKNMDVEAYDSEFAMFRWNAKTDSQILAEKIGGVGQITGLTVTERGPGGAAKALKVVGTEGSKTFHRPEQGAERAGEHRLVFNRKDGSTYTEWETLPSGFIF